MRANQLKQQMTRGPWHVEGEGDEYRYIISDDDTEPNGIVCRIDLHNDPVRSTADASIIAEAHAMYDVLYDLIYRSDSVPDILQSTIDRANALMDRLEKAR